MCGMCLTFFDAAKLQLGSRSLQEDRQWQSCTLAPGSLTVHLSAYDARRRLIFEVNYSHRGSACGREELQWKRAL